MNPTIGMKTTTGKKPIIRKKSTIGMTTTIGMKRIIRKTPRRETYRIRNLQ